MLALSCRTRLLAVLIVGIASFSSPSLANVVTAADITISQLVISGDIGFVFVIDNGTVTATAGPDSFGNLNSQSLVVSNPTTANAAISTATAQAIDPIAGFTDNVLHLSSTFSGNVSASSGVSLGGVNASSQSFGTSNPMFQFQAPTASATNPVHLTLSMTVAGSLTGTANSVGTYAGDIMAQFGYNSNSSPFAFNPVVSFDQSFTGGPSDNQNNIFAVQTLTGTVTLDTSADYFFQVIAHAQSSATDQTINPGVPEPSTWAMMILGFAGIGFTAYRRKQNGLMLRIV
jgi:PEP-CTERM motif